MALLNWKTEDKLKALEKRLFEVMNSTDGQIGSPAALREIAECVIELSQALRHERGPIINHDM